MMNTHSAEKNTIALVSGESAATGIVLESCVAGPVATLISDDGSGRRAFSIGEVQKMTCPRCQYTFPVGFYCIECGYVPTSREN
jgi:hypothetical protein